MEGFPPREKPYPVKQKGKRKYIKIVNLSIDNNYIASFI
jgi:hypothetical protein